MEIRAAELEDAGAISDLIVRAIIPYKDQDFTAEAWQRFCASNSADGLRSKLAEGRRCTMLAEADGELVGVVSVVDNEKIDQLFVCPKHRRRGVARRLWQSIHAPPQGALTETPYWVRSSSVGVPFYQSLGFRMEGSRQTTAGISFYLMVHGPKQAQ